MSETERSEDTKLFLESSFRIRVYRISSDELTLEKTRKNFAMWVWETYFVLYIMIWVEVMAIKDINAENNKGGILYQPLILHVIRSLCGPKIVKATHSTPTYLAPLIMYENAK